MELIQQRLNLETFEPHARCLQIDSTAAIPPTEIIVTETITTDTVDVAPATVLVPESSSSHHSAVPGAQPVVVTVVRSEHHPVAVSEGII